MSVTSDPSSLAPARAPRYVGPERRLHRVLVTKNTEYHLRGDLCVAVKDRNSAVWLEGHLAVGHELKGGVRVSAQGSAGPGGDQPALGDALYFSDGRRQLVTSVLCAVERPDPESLAAYLS